MSTLKETLGFAEGVNSIFSLTREQRIKLYNEIVNQQSQDLRDVND